MQMQIDAPPLALLGTWLLASSQITPSQSFRARLCTINPSMHAQEEKPSNKIASIYFQTTHTQKFTIGRNAPRPGAQRAGSATGCRPRAANTAAATTKVIAASHWLAFRLPT